MTQTMSEEAVLPCRAQLGGYELFPALDGGLNASWWKGDDPVQMVGHQQTQAAVPNELVMIVSQRGKNDVADADAAELVRSLGYALDGDKEPAPIGQPFRDELVQLIAKGLVHKSLGKKRGDVRGSNLRHNSVRSWRHLNKSGSSPRSRPGQGGPSLPARLG